jgi:hypothetical protein
MAEPFDTNPVTKLWVIIKNNALLTQQLNEYLQLTEIMVVSMLGSVKDEQTFSTLAFMKNKLCNKLRLHKSNILSKFPLLGGYYRLKGLESLD